MQHSRTCPGTGLYATDVLKYVTLTALTGKPSGLTWFNSWGTLYRQLPIVWASHTAYAVTARVLVFPTGLQHLCLQLALVLPSLRVTGSCRTGSKGTGLKHSVQ